MLAHALCSHQAHTVNARTPALSACCRGVDCSGRLDWMSHGALTRCCCDGGRRPEPKVNRAQKRYTPGGLAPGPGLERFSGRPPERCKNESDGCPCIGRRVSSHTAASSPGVGDADGWSSTHLISSNLLLALREIGVAACHGDGQPLHQPWRPAMC